MVARHQSRNLVGDGILTNLPSDGGQWPSTTFSILVAQDIPRLTSNRSVSESPQGLTYGYLLLKSKLYSSRHFNMSISEPPPLA